MNNTITKIELNPEDFGTLAICALRYCSGRHTYMPSLVQGICKKHIKEFTDKDIAVLLNDCDFFKDSRANDKSFGSVDAKDWKNWEQVVKEEKDCRGKK